MSDHYFSNQPQSSHNLQRFEARLRGKTYNFVTDAGVFSKDEIDTGSRILIEILPCQPGQRVLDLGCGYGPIGIVAADLVGPKGKVHLVDVNERAVSLAKINITNNAISNATALVSDGFEAIGDFTFDWILTNPPIRAGKAVIYALVEQAFQQIAPGGSLLVVIRTKQGAKSMEKKLADTFGQVATLKKEAGYRILQAKKV